MIPFHLSGFWHHGPITPLSGLDFLPEKIHSRVWIDCNSCCRFACFGESRLFLHSAHHESHVETVCSLSGHILPTHSEPRRSLVFTLTPASMTWGSLIIPFWGLKIICLLSKQLSESSLRQDWNVSHLSRSKFGEIPDEEKEVKQRREENQQKVCNQAPYQDGQQRLNSFRKSFRYSSEHTSVSHVGGGWADPHIWGAWGSALWRLHHLFWSVIGMCP